MKLARWALLILLVSGEIIAEGTNIVGTIDHTIQVKNAKNQLGYKARPANATKQIALLKVDLSNEARQKISRNIRKLQQSTHQSTSAAKYPGKIQLGMRNVPVLDQGKQGTCVTFATTAAIDAILNKGDYISQLCLLQLGNYLEKNTYSPSGWAGSSPRAVLNHIELFGIISKNKQRTSGCGGLTEYPLLGIEPNTEMSPPEYRQISKPINNIVGWSTILDDYQNLESMYGITKINAVKNALNSGDRLTIAVLLPDITIGTAGAIGTHQTTNDTWVLTPDILQDFIDFLSGSNPNFEIAAHAMVITGYDDDAVANDKNGREHKGLITLRNSWGENAGDKGNFYMSYDYFNILGLGVHRIKKIIF